MLAKKLLLTILIGLGSGFGVSAFLLSLEKIVGFHLDHPGLVLLLPVLGLILGRLTPLYGRSGKNDTGLILEEIHDPKELLPARFAPLVWISTILSHLGGASVGREGAAIQIASGISDLFSRWVPQEKEERRIILVSGMAAGFAAGIGTPFAGVVFALESIRWKNPKASWIPRALGASFVASGVALWLGVRRTRLPSPEWEILSASEGFRILVWSLITGILCAVLLRLFHFSTRLFQSALRRISLRADLRGLGGGAILAMIFLTFHLLPYQGLGIAGLESSFHQSSPPFAPLIKILLTAFSLASGFKGGEFVPLFFSGAALGSTLGPLAGTSPSILPAVGCTSLFAAASKTPAACLILAGELFGLPATLYSLPAMVAVHVLSGDPPSRSPFSRRNATTNP